ncbi:MAG: hypothetical protein EP332_14200 [Bacteroidetes bacterium]|nr:MAG: hypothetical protein EP332_14200 [Bacteroidota bacterium]
MKSLISLIVGLLLTSSIYGYCSVSGLEVFPSNQHIKQNSIFILEGYSTSQRIIADLNKKHSIYLKNGDRKINLIVSEILVGEFLLTQAILRPESELEAGLEYTMHIDSLPENEIFTRWNSLTNKRESPTYTILAGIDTLKPQIIQKPQELTKEYIEYGCGPSIHVVFSDSIIDSSEFLVKTTVKNLNTGEEISYYLQPYRNQIHVGHGMCSGAFILENGNEFEVEFSYMDSCGNLTQWIGERLKFTSPKQ